VARLEQRLFQTPSAIGSFGTTLCPKGISRAPCRFLGRRPKSWAVPGADIHDGPSELVGVTGTGFASAVRDKDGVRRKTMTHGPFLTQVFEQIRRKRERQVLDALVGPPARTR
jgi:hypothetical protein